MALFIRDSFVIKAFTIANNCAVYVQYIHAHVRTSMCVTCDMSGTVNVTILQAETWRDTEYINVVEKNVNMNLN